LLFALFCFSRTVLRLLVWVYRRVVLFFALGVTAAGFVGAVVAVDDRFVEQRFQVFAWIRMGFLFAQRRAESLEHAGNA
jgi:hypothetical protein